MEQWLADINAVWGLPLTIVGFALALWQILRTKSAAKSAEKAAKSTVTEISSNYLLILLPQLSRVESDLDSAVDQKDRRLAAAHMSQWRWQAGQLRGLLDGDDAATKKIAKAIQTSITLAATAKIDALDTSLVLADVTRPVQEAIAVVTGEVGQLSTRQNVTTRQNKGSKE